MGKQREEDRTKRVSWAQEGPVAWSVQAERYSEGSRWIQGWGGGSRVSTQEGMPASPSPVSSSLLSILRPF